MRTLLVVVLFASVGSLALADTSSTREATDLKTYGNCHTVTFLDLFTDGEDHAITCLESTFTDESIIGVMSQRDGLYVVVGKGLQFTLADQVPIMIRVDKGETIRRSAYWDSKNPTRAFIKDYDLATRLLRALAQGQRVVIKVGDEGGNIRLDGSSRAIQDFRQRAGLPTQQTLTPQQRQTLEVPARSF